MTDDFDFEIQAAYRARAERMQRVRDEMWLRAALFEIEIEMQILRALEGR